MSDALAESQSTSKQIRNQRRDAKREADEVLMAGAGDTSEVEEGTSVSAAGDAAFTGPLFRQVKTWSLILYFALR